MPYRMTGILTSVTVMFFAYLGFDEVTTMAEETKSCEGHSYWTDKTTDPDATYYVVFTKVGIDWVKYTIALGAFGDMVIIIMVGVVGQDRYLTHIARKHMFPPSYCYCSVIRDEQ